jgi:hypothetical protein
LDGSLHRNAAFRGQCLHWQILITFGFSVERVDLRPVWPDWAKFRHLGNIFALGAFFSKKYRPNDLGAIFSKISPKIHLNKL